MKGGKPTATWSGGGGGGEFQCEKCGLSGDDYAEMERHEARCGTAPAPGRAETFACEKCGLIGNNYEEIEAHEQSCRVGTAAGRSGLKGGAPRAASKGERGDRLKPPPKPPATSGGSLFPGHDSELPPAWDPALKALALKIQARTKPFNPGALQALRERSPAVALEALEAVQAVLASQEGECR